VYNSPYTSNVCLATLMGSDYRKGETYTPLNAAVRPRAAHPAQFVCALNFGLWARPIVRFLKQTCCAFFFFFHFFFFFFSFFSFSLYINRLRILFSSKFWQISNLFKFWFFFKFQILFIFRICSNSKFCSISECCSNFGILKNSKICSNSEICSNLKFVHILIFFRF
jgi:hypothetical protein